MSSYFEYMEAELISRNIKGITLPEYFFDEYAEIDMQPALNHLEELGYLVNRGPLVYDLKDQLKSDMPDIYEFLVSHQRSYIQAFFDNMVENEYVSLDIDDSGKVIYVWEQKGVDRYNELIGKNTDLA